MQIEIKASEKYHKTASTTVVVDQFLVCLMKCSSNDLSASSTHFEPHFTGCFISNNGRSDADNFRKNCLSCFCKFMATSFMMDLFIRGVLMWVVYPAQEHTFCSQVGNQLKVLKLLKKSQNLFNNPCRKILFCQRLIK